LQGNYILAAKLDIRDSKAELVFAFLTVESLLHAVSQETAPTCYEWLIQDLKVKEFGTKLKDEVNRLYLSAFHRAREKLIHVRDEK
jgi:hypothetical protein